MMNRRPHNNRVASSEALKTHSIWQDSIGYDPYAGLEDDKKKQDDKNKSKRYSDKEVSNFFKLAKQQTAGASEGRGACKKCGMSGHLTFQCMNVLGKYTSIENTNEVKSDSDSDSDSDEGSSSDDDSHSCGNIKEITTDNRLKVATKNNDGNGNSNNNENNDEVRDINGERDKKRKRKRKEKKEKKEKKHKKRHKEKKEKKKEKKHKE